MELKQTIGGKEAAHDRQNTADQSRTQMLERVNKELKKQLQCYKEEIDQFKKEDDAYLLVENYQKLVGDFNSLYDHYRAQKATNKKLRVELQQSN